MKKQLFAKSLYSAPNFKEVVISVEHGFEITAPGPAEDWQDGQSDFMGNN